MQEVRAERKQIFYAHTRTEADNFVDQPVVFFLKEAEKDTLLLTREFETPIRRHEWKPTLEFQAMGFDEIIVFNFHLEEKMPDKDMIMYRHFTPTILNKFTRCEKLAEGVFKTPIILDPQIVAYVDTCLTEDEYAVLKWDVLALKGDKWYLFDPGTGISP